MGWLDKTGEWYEVSNLRRRLLHITYLIYYSRSEWMLPHADIPPFTEAAGVYPCP
jgi:hypothetical protein